MLFIKTVESSSALCRFILNQLNFYPVVYNRFTFVFFNSALKKITFLSSFVIVCRVSFTVSYTVYILILYEGGGGWFPLFTLLGTHYLFLHYRLVKVLFIFCCFYFIFVSLYVGFFFFCVACLIFILLVSNYD